MKGSINFPSFNLKTSWSCNSKIIFQWHLSQQKAFDGKYLYVQARKKRQGNDFIFFHIIFLKLFTFKLLFLQKQFSVFIIYHYISLNHIHNFVFKWRIILGKVGWGDRTQYIHISLGITIFYFSKGLSSCSFKKGIAELVLVLCSLLLSFYSGIMFHCLWWSAQLFNHCFYIPNWIYK